MARNCRRNKVILSGSDTWKELRVENKRRRKKKKKKNNFKKSGI